MPTEPPAPVLWPDDRVAAYTQAHKLDKVTWLATTPFGTLAGFENGSSRIVSAEAPSVRMPLKAKYR